ncbi:MAG: polysaccharide biosynthesis tyrosine autokinase, partial [Candidatus Aureabacteria bacterium]|nr:polysaccharide biosynthesis tyrosine autokinase [Candidatus Auribacterota bacterium]
IARSVFDEFNLSRKEEYAEAKDPLSAFLKTIKVEPVRDTRLLSLHVDNKDPVLAAEIANRIADIYVERNLYYISRDEMMNLLKNEYLKLDAKLSEYSKTYKSRHPQMIRLKEEMNEMVRAIENVKKSIFEYGMKEEDFLTGGEHSLKGLKANNVSILDIAAAPVIPTKPKKKLYILLAAVMGVFGGIGLAFFFEYLDDTVKSIEDTEKLADWLLLGAIPDIGKVRKGFKKYEKGFLAHIKPKDSVVEVYRSIRTRLLISSAENKPLSIAVTSPGPGEGKTTNLSNLGTVIAHTGKRVLLVDADMRKPNLHKVFRKKNRGKNSEKGLSDFLSGRAEFKDLVQETEIENTFLVTCGACPPNPSELISNDKMKEFINSAK